MPLSHWRASPSAAVTCSANRVTISWTTLSPSSLDAFVARILAVDGIQRVSRIVRGNIFSRRVGQRDAGRVAAGRQPVEMHPGRVQRERNAGLVLGSVVTTVRVARLRAS